MYTAYQTLDYAGSSRGPHGMQNPWEQATPQHSEGSWQQGSSGWWQQGHFEHYCQGSGRHFIDM